MKHARTRSVGTVAAGACALALSVFPAAAQAKIEPSSWPPTASGEPAAPAAASTARLYVMTFRDVPVTEVAEAVLGDALRLPYQVSPQIDGAMTFEIDERLTPPQLLASFEAALRGHGIALRDTGSQLSLAPLTAAAVATPAPVSVVPVKPLTSDWAGMLGLLAACAVVGAGAAVWMARRAGSPKRSSAREAVLDYLVESGAVGRRQVARARLVAMREGGPVERVLVRDEGVPAEGLVEAYAAASGAAIWRPGAQPPLDPQPRYDGEAVGEEMLVLADDGAQLTVATTDPLDDAAMARLLFAAGRKLRIMVASPEDMARARRSLRSLHVVGLVAG